MQLIKTLTIVSLFTLLTFNANCQKVAAYTGIDINRIIEEEGTDFDKKVDEDGRKYIEYENLFGGYLTKFYYSGSKCRVVMVFYSKDDLDVIYKMLRNNDNAIKKDSKTFYSISHESYLYFIFKDDFPDSFMLLVTKKRL